MKFTCINCRFLVEGGSAIGTRNRNHCPKCLWSKHVDLDLSGDRKSECKSGMKPFGLTFKKEGLDKYGKPKQGELMIIHECIKCGKVSINRIAGDDDEKKILEILAESQNLNERDKTKISGMGIDLLGKSDFEEVETQLYGKPD